MITYYIEKDGVVIGEGACPEDQLDQVNTYGGTLVLETDLPRASTDVATAALIRRQGLLIASDWTQLPDVPLATKQAWTTYRQALRDITDQPGYPDNIAWPETPQ